MNGANCGTLCFRNEEFCMIMESHCIRDTIIFINETPQMAEDAAHNSKAQ